MISYPSKPVVVLLLLSQGGDVGKRVEGSRIVSAFLALNPGPLASDAPVISRRVLEALGVLWPCRPPTLKTESRSVVPGYASARKAFCRRERVFYLTAS